LLSIKLWWCEKYNRPLKDPLLEDYTEEELLFEYFTLVENESYRKELKEEGDRIKEEESLEEDNDWADQMEAMEKESKQPEEEPELTQDDIEWMQKEIQEDEDHDHEDMIIDF
jgi:hypothetical protein